MCAASLLESQLLSPLRACVCVCVSAFVRSFCLSADALSHTGLGTVCVSAAPSLMPFNALLLDLVVCHVPSVNFQNDFFFHLAPSPFLLQSVFIFLYLLHIDRNTLRCSFPPTEVGECRKAAHLKIYFPPPFIITGGVRSEYESYSCLCC